MYKLKWKLIHGLTYFELSKDLKFALSHFAFFAEPNTISSRETIVFLAHAQK